MGQKGTSALRKEDTHVWNIQSHGRSQAYGHRAGDATHLSLIHIFTAISLLLELAEQTGSSQLPHEVEAYLSVVIYKVYRYLYMADPAGVEAVFRTSREQFEYLCDARMKEHELRIRTACLLYTSRCV